MKFKNFYISVVIAIAFAGIVLLLIYPSDSPLGTFFEAVIVLMVMYYLAIAYGILLLLLRLFRFLKGNRSLIYVLAGTLNIFLAIVGITLFATDQADQEWLHKSIANLFVGFLILSDTFFLRERVRG